MKIKTIKDIPEINGKRILLRVDYNVPLKENGEIQDDTRIRESLETIKYLKEHGGKIIILSHLGRPDGKVKEELRLTKIAQHLGKLLGEKIKKFDEIFSEEIKKAVSNLKSGEIVILENVRFDRGEEKCDENFTKNLASLGEIFVSDGFSVAHRKHASTAGLADYLPAYGGFLMGKEINAMSPILEQEPIRPLTMIFGGAKIDTKISIIKNFIAKADYFLIGGGLANTFLAAAGYDIGHSLWEKEKVDMAREIMLDCEKHHEKFILPHDVVVASEISDTAQTANVAIEDVISDMKILDIGKWSTEKFQNIILSSGTVIWNGPLGYCEKAPFRHGTRAVGETLANHNCISIIGGGDTIDCLNTLGIDNSKFTHVSTGGGACIEFLSGDKLPGIEVLKV